MQTVKELISEQNQYISNAGGVLEIKEADSFINNNNREQISAFRRENQSAFLVNVNKGEIFTEYTGQKIYNFACDAVIPSPDPELKSLIESWREIWNMETLHSITSRIEQLNGIAFIWY